MTYDVVIVGSGPTGCTAAIYAARGNLSTFMSQGAQPGGQLMITTDVENYPGFPEGILGPDLMEKFKSQAERFGAEISYSTVTDVDLECRPFKVTLDAREVIEAKTIIIATGSSARWLGLESEQALMGFGVSACATCDGFFFKGKELAIVGGGDSAMEEATFLTKFATKVTVVHRRDALRASKIMQERAFKNEKIEFLWHSEITDVLTETGKEVVGVKIKNTQTGEESTLDVQGLFLAIGHDPNTAVFKGKVDMDENDYVLQTGGHTMTNVPGVFAAGDCVDHRYQQAVTAAGYGCEAALDAEKWLEDQGEG